MIRRQVLSVPRCRASAQLGSRVPNQGSRMDACVEMQGYAQPHSTTSFSPTNPARSKRGLSFGPCALLYRLAWPERDSVATTHAGCKSEQPAASCHGRVRFPCAVGSSHARADRMFEIPPRPVRLPAPCWKSCSTRPMPCRSGAGRFPRNASIQRDANDCGFAFGFASV